MPSNTFDDLVERARASRKNAYAPYSGFAVGAALLAKNGEIYSGANVENASYGLAICAERSAVASAVTAGQREFAAIAVAGPDSVATVPCGACRQVLSEFNPSLVVLYTTPDGVSSTTLDQLLPLRFDFARRDKT